MLYRYYHNVFMVTHALGHIMYGLLHVCIHVLDIYKHRNNNKNQNYITKTGKSKCNLVKKPWHLFLHEKLVILGKQDNNLLNKRSECDSCVR